MQNIHVAKCLFISFSPGLSARNRIAVQPPVGIPTLFFSGACTLCQVFHRVEVSNPPPYNEEIVTMEVEGMRLNCEEVCALQHQFNC